MSNKLFELLEKVGSFITKTLVENMADWGCTFHELIMVNERLLKPNKP
jgi:hypothetical protein